MSNNALIHPYSVLSRDENTYVRIVSGKGVKLTDDAGNEYIDALASLWLCQIGHGNRTVIDAINAQLEQLQTYNTFRAVLEWSRCRGGRDGARSVAAP